MTTSTKRTFPALNLAQQGIFLVVALLLCEFVFVGTLSALMAQAEQEARRQDFAREVTAKASRLLLVVYDTGDAVGKFTAQRAIGSSERFKEGLSEIPPTIAWLKENLRGKTEPERLLANIEKNIAVCLPVIAGIKRDAETMSKKEAMQIWRERRMPIQGNVDRLIDDLEALMTYSRAIEDEAPDKERAQRGATRVVLLGGLAVNIVFFVAMILFFTRRITRRLDVIGANINRLETGAPLLDLLQGTDEIAEVDRVFHETAEAVRREEALLKGSEARLRNILESVPIGVLVLSEDRSIESVNPAVAICFGYEAAELIGKKFDVVLPADAVIGVDELMNAEAGQITEITARRKNGVVFPADFSLAQVVVAGTNKQIAMIVDASERYELKKLRLSFVNMISEELRTPLTVLDDFFTQLRAKAFGDLSSEVEERTGKAQQNIQRLLLLLNDLFDLERLESGKIEVEPVVCSLSSILEQSLDAVSSFAQKKHVTIVIPKTELTVFADSDRIIQVVVNLLSNAVKFSPENSQVEVEVGKAAAGKTEAGTIQAVQGSFVEIAVVDHGRGIPDERIGSLFQQFQQVDARDGTEKGGTGLGLVICKAIVEEHGGRIGVTSKSGEGSRFWMQLPADATSSKATLGPSAGKGRGDV